MNEADSQKQCWTRQHSNRMRTVHMPTVRVWPPQMSIIPTPWIPTPLKGPGTRYTYPPEGTWYQRYLPPRRDLVPEIPTPLWTGWQTPCDNITFLQQLLRAVKKDIHGTGHKNCLELTTKNELCIVEVLLYSKAVYCYDVESVYK